MLVSNVDSEEDNSDDEFEAELAASGLMDQEEREAIYNVDGLHEGLEQIGWDESVIWEEGRIITSETPTQVSDINDDLSRELAFYNQALASAREACDLFGKAKVPFRRPDDYYAEMVKSDEHMGKVRERLLVQQKQIEESEQRRKQREAKRYGKQVQAEVLKERKKNKKDMEEKLTKWRKERNKTGATGDEDEFPMEMMQDKPQAVKGDRSRSGGNKASKKREAKNAKFGFGGRKRLAKQNSAGSSADVDGFRPSRPGVKGGISKKGGKGGAASKRPGKARRQQARGGK